MDIRAAISYIFAISKTEHRGILIWESGDDFRIIMNGREHAFATLEQATVWIDFALDAAKEMA